MKRTISFALSLVLAVTVVMTGMSFEANVAHVADKDEFKATMLATGNRCTWAVTPKNQLYFWGYSNTGNMEDCKRSLHWAEEFGESIKFVSSYEYSSVTFAIRTDGSLWGWGQNYDGLLGDGTNEEARWGEPRWIMNDVKEISQSSSTVLAVKTNGELWAWGSNWSGEVGDNTTNPVLTPKRIISSDVVSATAGGNHSMAVKSDGTLLAWGNNDSYQFGSGDTVGSLVPKPIMTGVKSAVADGCYSFIIKTNGELWACGDNWAGQLGDGTSQTTCTTPKRILGSERIAAVSTNGLCTIAIDSFGGLWGWGDNQYGQLGNGTLKGSLLPQKILAGGAKTVSTGMGHTALIKTDDTVWMCGSNDMYQLGNGTTEPSYSFKQI